MNRDPKLDPFSAEADPYPPDGPPTTEDRRPISDDRSPTTDHGRPITDDRSPTTDDPSRRAVGKLALCAVALGMAESCVPHRLACETLPSQAEACRHRFCRYYGGGDR